MRFIIGLILFWLSNFGYMLFIKKKSKLPYEFILPILFTLIGIVMFLAGILDMMKEISILVCLVGICFLGKYIFKKEIKWKNILNVNFILLLIIFVYITVVCGKMMLLHYDNFSHWGLIVKTMFIRDGLPNFENALLEFKNYQPGSACFIYYFGFLTGKTEGSMIVAQNYLLVSYLFSLLVFTNNKKKEQIKNYVLKGLLVVCYFFFMFGNIEFYNLLVDTLIASMSICSLVIFYYFRDDLKKAFIYTLPVSIYLFLVKNTGIVLVGFNCLMLLLIGFKNKQIKKGFIYALISGIITVLFFLIWSKHVSYVYGALSLSSKHSLSTANILLELRTKGWDRIFEFCGIYLKHFISLSSNLPNKYMIVINILLVLMMLVFKKYRKNIGLSLILCDVIYLLYYGILGIMYLLSMPWAEAVYLAGFDRYMLTIVFVIIGIVLITFFNVCLVEKKKSRKSICFAVMIIVLFLGFNWDYISNNYKLFLGEQNYEETTANYFDKVLGSDMYTADSDDYYYVYAPITSYNDYGYLNYLSKFKINSLNVLVVRDIAGIENNMLELDRDYNINIIVVDEDSNIFEYIDDNDFVKNEYIYVKEMDNKNEI